MMNSCIPQSLTHHSEVSKPRDWLKACSPAVGR